MVFTGSAENSDEYTGAASVGLIFYQAGILVLTASILSGTVGAPGASDLRSVGDDDVAGGLASRLGITRAMTGSAIETLAGGFRHLINDIDFNNTIELNSAIYFCRINHNEYNYSSNPTYVAGSKLVVKNNVNDLPISYLTTVGLYSPDNELLAVAKLSEPIRKDPNTELTLRVRLDY